MKIETQNILFYDGNCGFCSFWVQFFSERDRNKKIYYAPLQGQTAQSMLPKDLTINTETIVFLYEGTVLIKSEAILKAFKVIHYSPDLLFFVQLFPKFFLNKIYDFIARHRYKLFGQNSICPIPSEDLKRQLLG
jgi:predicted DCC family thiol-disulfide oxidoreductase YuxK